MCETTEQEKRSTAGLQARIDQILIDTATYQRGYRLGLDGRPVHQHADHSRRLGHHNARLRHEARAGLEARHG